MSGRAGPRRAVVRRSLLAVVRFYQRAVSPALPPRCRFYPTCSAYAVEALETHGALRGTGLTVVRILKCAPWHPGGVDLVPGPRGAGAPRGTDAGAASSSTAGSSSTAAPVAGPTTADRRPSTTVPPARPGTAQEESSVV